MKNFIWILLMAVSGMGFAQQPPNYEIKGKLEGISNVSTVYLYYRNGRNNVIDSARVTDNTYTLKGYIEVGQQATLLCFKLNKSENIVPNGLLFVFLAPGNYNITHAGQFNHTKITGSAAQDEYTALMANANSRKDDPSYKDAALGDFIKAHPTSPVAFAALMELGDIGKSHHLDGLRLKPYYDLLPDKVKETEAGRLLGEQITTAIKFAVKGAVGTPVTDFTLADTAGRLVKLSDIKGKYILIDFWASWCTPCRADNPHLVAAYKQFHSKGFNIISVSLDVKAREKAWHKAIVHDNLTAWTHVADLEHDTNTAADLYGLQAIPQNFLIGPDGKIIARSLRGGDLEKKLGELLSN